MSFKIHDQKLDILHKLFIDGQLWACSGVNDNVSIEISAESRDATDNKGNIIRTTWRSKTFKFCGLGLDNDRNVSIELDNSDRQHVICLTGKGWRYRPHKNRRIAKKWKKKYGEQYCNLCINVCLRGQLIIE